VAAQLLDYLEAEDAPFGRIAIAARVLFFGLLILLPIAVRMTEDRTLALFDRFYRAGPLVFGSGHVVLRLLRNELASLAG